MAPKTTTLLRLALAITLALQPGMALAETKELAKGQTFYTGSSGESRITGSSGDDLIRGDPTTPAAGPTSVIRLSEASQTVGGSGESNEAVFSPDGTLIAFASTATNLVTGVQPVGVTQIYLNDVRTGQITLLSRSKTGEVGNKGSISPSFSPDGKMVVFATFATNLGAIGANNSRQKIVVANIETAAMTLVSRSRETGLEQDDNCFSPAFSPDGQWVVYASVATNLTKDGDPSKTDLYISKIGDYTKTARVSASASGSPGAGQSFGFSYSPDGGKIAFSTDSDNLISGGSGGFRQIVIKTLGQTNSTGNVTGALATVTKGNGNSFGPNYSPDGRAIAFFSFADNFGPTDANGASDVYVNILASGGVAGGTTGQVRMVSTAADGGQGNGDSGSPVFSPDGVSILFASSAMNLASGADNGKRQILLKNLATGAVTLVSRKPNAGQGALDSLHSARNPFSLDGRSIVFDSFSTNLVTGDTTTKDVFLAKLPPTPGGNDVLKGGAGRDLLFGVAGADKIIGGSGADTLTGGPGRDTFVFNRSTDSRKGKNRRDTITDFNARGREKIDLSRFDANSVQKKRQHFNFIGKKRFSGKPGELRFVRKSGLLQGDTTGNRKPNFEVKVVVTSGKFSKRNLKLK